MSTNRIHTVVSMCPTHTEYEHHMCTKPLQLNTYSWYVVYLHEVHCTFSIFGLCLMLPILLLFLQCSQNGVSIGNYLVCCLPLFSRALFHYPDFHFIIDLFCFVLIFSFQISCVIMSSHILLIQNDWTQLVTGKIHECLRSQIQIQTFQQKSLLTNTHKVKWTTYIEKCKYGLHISIYHTIQPTT